MKQLIIIFTILLLMIPNLYANESINHEDLYSQNLSIFYGQESLSFYGPEQEDKSNLILMSYDIETNITEYVSYSHSINIGSLRDEIYSAETFGYMILLNLKLHDFTLTGGIGVSYIQLPDKLTHLADSPLYANIDVGLAYNITDKFSVSYRIKHYSSPYTTKDGGKNYGCLSANFKF